MSAVMGRPSEYTQDACRTVIEMGLEGKSVVQMACAIGVHRDTLYEWEKVHSEFSDAFTRARQLSQSWWEDFGQANLLTQGMNASLYNKIVGSRFKADYGDRQAIEHTGKDGGPIQTQSEVRPQLTREEWLATYVDAPARPAASSD